MMKFIHKLIEKPSKKDCCDVLIQEVEERATVSCCKPGDDRVDLNKENERQND